MYKEIAICIVILIIILIGNYVTQKFTKDSVQVLSDDLGWIKEQLLQQQVGNDDFEENLKKVQDDWEKRQDKLAFYIEHNELEKIATSFTAMKSYIITEEYDEFVNEVDKCIFLLKHIEDKYVLSLQNIL